MEDRINQLEALSALQDETIQNLNKELFRQQQDLAQLRQQMTLLEQKLARLQEQNPIVENEKPPHW